MRIIPTILVVLFLASCSHNRIIPEITTFIHSEQLNTIPLDKDIFAMFSYGNSIILPSVNGYVFSFSTEKREIKKIIDIGFPLKKYYLFQNGILSLSSTKGETKILFDIEEKRVISTLKCDPPDKIIGVSSNNLLLLRNSKLAVIDHKKDETVISFPIKDRVVICGEILGKKAFVLCKKSIVVIDLKRKSEEIIKLRNTPISHFLMIGNHIYYGDKERNLIKFSLKKKITEWKYKLPKKLVLKPMYKNGLIIASAEDNNTYLITVGGGLKYWYRSKATRLFAPALMKNHIAEVLKTENGTTINFYGIKEKSFNQFFVDKIRLGFPPVFNNKNIYSVTSDKNGTGRIPIKIGNKFGTIIKTEPSKNFKTGKTVKISLKIVNIFKPEIRIEIFDSEMKELLSKTIRYNEQRVIGWIPTSGGKFTIKVSTRDEDGTVRTDTKEILVSNPSKIFRELQKDLHKKCADNNKPLNRSI